MADYSDKSSVRCSFCGKRDHAVRRMLHSPGANICDECVALCYNMLAEEGIFAPMPQAAGSVSAEDFNLLKPAQIKAVLDKFFSFYMRGKQSDIMKGKQCALLSCLEETDVEIGNESVRAPYLRAIELLGWNSIGEVIVPGVYEAGAIKSTDGEERAARLVELIY